MIIWVIKKCVSVVDINIRWIAVLPSRLPGSQFGSAAGPVAETPV